MATGSATTPMCSNDANESGDGDGDGVGDNADQCLDTEAGAVVDATGCLVVTDSDGDGVACAERPVPQRERLGG